MIETALFDVDGTLLDSNAAHAAAWHDALAEFGYDIPVQRIRPLIGMGGDRILPLIDPALDDGTEPGASIGKRRGALFLAQYVDSIVPTRGARELLVALRERGVRRVIATSAQPGELDRLLARGDLGPLFDARATADDAASSKPAPDIVAAALERSGSPAARAVLIGDTRYDIESAHAAGIRAIGLLCGGSSRAELQAADEIYADPGELLAALDFSKAAA
ncbi:MAG: HAD family hydrolase [Candidatus Velthaea sp.]